MFYQGERVKGVGVWAWGERHGGLKGVGVEKGAGPGGDNMKGGNSFQGFEHGQRGRLMVGPRCKGADTTIVCKAVSNSVHYVHCHSRASRSPLQNRNTQHYLTMLQVHPKCLSARIDSRPSKTHGGFMAALPCR